MAVGDVLNGGELDSSLILSDSLYVNGLLRANAYVQVPTNALIVGSPSLSSLGAGLEINSTTLALLVSRVTTAQQNAITNPQAGMVIYNTTTSKLRVYSGGAWTDLH